MKLLVQQKKVESAPSSTLQKLPKLIFAVFVGTYLGPLKIGKKTLDSTSIILGSANG